MSLRCTDKEWLSCEKEHISTDGQIRASRNFYVNQCAIKVVDANEELNDFYHLCGLSVPGYMYIKNIDSILTKELR